MIDHSAFKHLPAEALAKLRPRLDERRVRLDVPATPYAAKFYDDVRALVDWDLLRREGEEVGPEPKIDLGDLSDSRLYVLLGGQTGFRDKLANGNAEERVEAETDSALLIALDDEKHEREQTWLAARNLERENRLFPD
jgi:hypothetical protein